MRRLLWTSLRKDETLAAKRLCQPCSEGNAGADAARQSVLTIAGFN